MINNVLLLLLFFFPLTPLLGLSSSESDPRIIMDTVENRDQGDQVKSLMIMRIFDAQNRERTRHVTSWSKDFAEGKKRLMIFSSPADVKNTGLLTIDYNQKGKSDDQWLYLPSLRKSTRISSSDKSGSFMGSDLTYSDMSTKDLSQYKYTLLKPSVKVKGEECWLIESRPITGQAKEETGYLKSKLWISKERHLPLQIKSWILEGKKLKYIKFDQIKKVNNLWIAHKILVKTTSQKKVLSSTIIEYQSYEIGHKEVIDELFTHRRLAKGL